MTRAVPAVGRYTVAEDFSNVINYDDLDHAFSDEAKQMLLQNGFVVVGEGMEEFFSLYENNRYSLTPNFVTTDAMMHTYHLFFSRLLKNVEREHFCADLMNLGTAMRMRAWPRPKLLKGTEWEMRPCATRRSFPSGWRCSSRRRRPRPRCGRLSRRSWSSSRKRMASAPRR